MASKTLHDALLKAEIKTVFVEASVLMHTPLFELKDYFEASETLIIDRLKSELRDYFAHEIYRHIAKLKKDGKPWETAEYQLIEFFELVFKDVLAYKTKL